VIYNVQHNHQDYDLVDPRLTDQIVQRAARESGELSLDILTTPARFDLDEVEVGPLLGSGGFSNVYEITGLRPKENSTRYNEDAMEARNNLAAKSRDCAKSKMHPYALKHLRRKLVAQPKKYANGAIDLAIEATFLTCFDHPNILNIHGVVSEGSEAFRKGRHDSFFLIVDRLEETLQDRIITWRKQHKRLSGMWSRIVRNKRRKNDRLLVKRLKVAFDIASALCYLHSKRLIYRDTKPTNIGFGLDGTVKLFDFGLCRELPESGDQSANALFEMSGGIGTYRCVVCSMLIFYID
jgi:serine/threonine protein kinase